MDIVSIIKDRLPKHTPSASLLAPANRAFLLFLTVIGIAIAGWVLYATLQPSSDDIVQNISTSGVALDKAKVTTNSIVTEEYAQDIKTVNKQSYEESKKKVEGSSLPTLYNSENTGEDVIKACACSFDEVAKEALIKEILARGVGRIGNSDAMRVGMSDIYIRPSSLIVDELNKPYLYNKKQISTDDTGALVYTKNGSPVLSLNDTPIHLSNVGVFFDKTTTKLIMAGKLLSSSGVIVLGDGLKASRPGMMVQIGASDTFLTNELQLATMDGKPVMHSGNFVFKGEGERLHNAYNENIVWNDKPVLQTEDGKLTDRNIKQFQQLGILFSYESILIDNNSMLTQKINDASRFGTSDIYVNKNNDLIDRHLNDITHRDYRVKNGLNNELLTQLGALRNNIGERVTIENNGRLKAVKGIVLTGTMKSGLNVAYDKYGHLITRKGKLKQLGESDVHVTNDRFLSSGRGLALQNNGKDTFQDINRFKIIDKIEAYGLKSHDGVIIRDLLKKEVYLNALGQFVYLNGEIISQTGLLAEDGGILIDPEGTLLNKQKVKQLITDRNGNKVSYNNMDVYANSEGQLFDENGDPVLDALGQAVYLKDGVLVNASGDVVAEGVLFSGKRAINKEESFLITEPLLGDDGKPIFINGVEAFVAADGSLVDRDGNPILGDDGEPLFLDDENKITNAKGQVQDVNFENDQGTIIRDVVRGKPSIKTARGNEVLYNGKPVTMVDGFLVDSEGKLILDEDGNRVLMNEEGQFVDENGNIVNIDGLTVNGESSDLSDGLLTKKILLDENGNPETYNGRKIIVNEDGSLSYLDGTPVIDKFGQRVFKVGDEFTNSTGGLIDFVTDDNSPFKDIEVVTGPNGSVLMHNGKKVYKRADGTLIDEDGNPILGVDGKPLFMNDNNEVVSVDGELADMRDFTLNGEPAKNIGLLSSRIKDGDLPSSLLGIESITSPNGSPLMFNGKKVFKRADGILVDENGNVVTGKNGKPLTMNENGDIVNADGTNADMNKFTINGKSAERIDLTANPLDISELPDALKPSSIKALTSPDGSPLMFNGKKVFKRADGTLVDENGNVVTGKNGKPLTMNENGDIVNADGTKADMSNFTVNGKSAEGLDIIDKAVSHIDLPENLQSQIVEAVLGLDGTPLHHNGKRVFKRADGILVDENGVPLVSADGKRLMLNDNNEIIDAEGLNIEAVIGPDGGPLMFNGKKVFKLADGTLVDENGEIVLGENGKPLTMNVEGDIVNADGTKADMSKFTINGKSAEGVDLTANSIGISELPVALQPSSLKSLTGPDGSPLMFNGKKVFKRADGTLVDENGNVVFGKNGKPLTMNAEGDMVNADGSKADMNKFTVNGKSAKGLKISDKGVDTSRFSVNGNKVSGRDLMKIETSKLPSIGDTGIRVTSDGLLIDKEGKEITHNGRAIRRGKDGKLYYNNGSPVLDDQGREVFMGDDGKLHDGNGKGVTGVTLLNGDNQLVGGSELEAKKIGDSDLFVNKRNNLVDASNKPFIHKGKPILVKGGKLVTDDNKPVVDIKGNPISITRSGSLIDRSRLPAKGAFVTDINGVVIDNKGRYVNSGGKMTALSDGGPYVTEGGLLVDKDGKAILINGKQVYVDEQNQLTSHNGRPVRYKGRKLHLDKRGNVLDENDDLLTFEGETVTLTNDGLTGSSGQSLNTTIKKESSSTSLNNVKELLKKEEVQPRSAVKEAEKSTVKEQIKKNNENNRLETEDEEISLTSAQIMLVNARYEERKAFLKSKVQGYKTTFIAKPKASKAEIGGGEYVEQVSTSKAENKSQENVEDTLSAMSAYEEGDEKFKAGKMLYAVNTYKVNTDLNTKLVFNLFGVERGSKLYKGTAHGQVELVYDYIVVNFNKICPVEGECITFEGVGVDPGTSEAAIDGDIDRHFWYRFAGLSFAALFQGAAEAVESSKERTEQTDEFGKTVTYSGLDTDKLLISSTGVLAETLGGIFTENVSRPYTGTIEKDEEIGIFLMEDLIIKK